MKFKAALLAAASMFAFSLSFAGDGVRLDGAGATFPAPLYKQWIKAWRDIDPKASIGYTSVGSEEGVRRFLDDSVDFGASDAPLTDDWIRSARHGVVAIPATAGMVVLVYNLPGLKDPLKLSRDTCAALLMGRIPRWSDARIQAINPGLDLPDREIVLVARLDGSGTTYALTNHMNAVNPRWSRIGPGVGTRVNWPVGTMLMAGNESVSARVKLAVGSIGYVEYGFAKRLGLPMAVLENRDGNYVAPADETGAAAIATSEVKGQASAASALADPVGANAYPVVSYSWLVLRKEYGDAAKAAALKRFVAWGLEAGQDSATALGYIKLPANASQFGRDLLTNIH